MKYREVIARIEKLKTDMSDIELTLFTLRSRAEEEDMFSSDSYARRDQRCSVIVLLKVYDSFNSELNKLLDGDV